MTSEGETDIEPISADNGATAVSASSIAPTAVIFMSSSMVLL
jgi:hypothetical protein